MSTDNLGNGSNPTLDQIIAIAKTKKNKNVAIQIGSINSAIASRVREETQQEIDRFKLFVDVYHVRHVLNNHFDKNLEHKRGNFPLRESDFKLIKIIATSPDQINFDKGKQGQWLIIFLRIKIRFDLFIVFSVSKKKKRLLFKSMYKRKKKKPR